MLQYRIMHHVPGRIRLEVQTLKGLAIATLKQLSVIPIPTGISSIKPNPLTGSLVITYDPGQVDILKYLEEVVANKDIKRILGREMEGV